MANASRLKRCPPFVWPSYQVNPAENIILAQDHHLTMRVHKWQPTCGRLSRSVNSSAYWQSACEGLRCVFLRHLIREFMFPTALRYMYKAHAGAQSRLSAAGITAGSLPTIASASVEVGVWMGRFSQYLLRELTRGSNTLICRQRPAAHQHYMVDPYRHYKCTPTQRDKQCLINQTEFDRIHDQVVHDFHALKYGNCTSVVRNFSAAGAHHLAASQATRRFLNFAYIDARHDYEGIMEDLRTWWPLMRRGALIGGHDYTTTGVAMAVHDFIKTRGPAQALRPIFVTKDNPASWATIVA